MVDTLKHIQMVEKAHLAVDSNSWCIRVKVSSSEKDQRLNSLLLDISVLPVHKTKNGTRLVPQTH